MILSGFLHLNRALTGDTELAPRSPLFAPKFVVSDLLHIMHMGLGVEDATT